jgi:hypothetical protein
VQRRACRGASARLVVRQRNGSPQRPPRGAELLFFIYLKMVLSTWISYAPTINCGWT